jgi:hypothetical protein
MTRIRIAAAIAVFGVATAAIVEACTTNNPTTQPYVSSGSSSGSSGTPDGGSSGDTGASGSSGASSSGRPLNSATCPAPTRYIDYTGDSGPMCTCAGQAYSVDGGACTCQVSTPLLCNYDAGQPPLCVDKTIDPGNCGGCGMKCNPKAGCNASTCGPDPGVFVAAAPGCVSMRTVIENGIMYWADMGHGSIMSKPLAAEAGGAATTIATGLHIAAVQSNTGPLPWPVNPFATSILVHNGTVYWIGAADTVTPVDDAGTWRGGVGTSIMSVSAGTQPKTILSAAMAPGPSPVSSSDAMFAIEKAGQNPPILAMALSPDFMTIYFAAGTRYYSIPAAGAVGAPTYVGYTQGPEHGEPTALAVDSNYLYAPTNLSGNIEILKIGSLCAEDAGPWAMGKGLDGEDICPARMAKSQGSLAYDEILVRAGQMYWGNGSNVHSGDVQSAIGGNPMGADYPSTKSSGNLTGFAIGTQYAYYGEDGYIEKGTTQAAAGSTPTSMVIARGQPQPGSFVLDGTNVYWTTSNCDINFIRDTPQ